MKASELKVGDVFTHECSRERMAITRLGLSSDGEVFAYYRFCDCPTYSDIEQISPIFMGMASQEPDERVPFVYRDGKQIWPEVTK